MNILSKIQTELNAPKNQRNNFGNYNYRSCEDILEGLKPLLVLYECSVIVSDSIEMVGSRIYVKATAKLFRSVSTGAGQDSNLIGESTAYAREPEQQKGMNEAQITGSASSYARKYALNGLFAIDDNKDADTNEHQNNANKRPSTPVNNDIKQQILNRLSTLTEQEKDGYRAEMQAGNWKMDKTFLNHLISKYGSK